MTAIYLTAGYPEPVARLLSGLCTNTVPTQVMHQVTRAASDGPARPCPGKTSGPTRARTCPRVRRPRPPSPTSSPTGSTHGWRRLVGRRGSRLHPLRRRPRVLRRRFLSPGRSTGSQTQVAAIAIEEGFAVQHRKTRIMRQGVRRTTAGVVINQKINMPRDDYDRLKAILCNCVKRGPAEQNRSGVADFRAHLAGRVAHAARLNPQRGQNLDATVRAGRVVNA